MSNRVSKQAFSLTLCEGLGRLYGKFKPKTRFEAWIEYNHTYTHAAPPAGDVGSVWNDGSDRWKPTLNASSSPEAEAQ